MVILPSGVINVLWLMVWGAELVEISSCSSPIHADFLVNLGRYGPCPPCPREAPSLPPSVDPRNVLFSTSAWIFATWLPPHWKKRRAECVSEVSGMRSRFASCFRNLLEDRRHTSNNQNTCFQTTSVFRLRSDESRDLDWDERWFSVQTYFRGCVDTFENNSLAFILESPYPPQERNNIYAPFLNFCLVLLILFVM